MASKEVKTIEQDKTAGRVNCDYEHPLYTRRQYTRRSVRDAVDGTDSVKRAQTVYLPMPSGMIVNPVAANETRAPTNMGSMTPNATSSTGNSIASDAAYEMRNAPYYHSNDAYRAYLQRARFPEITVHTLKGLVGTATRIPMKIDLPNKLKYMEEAATNDGLSLEQLYGFLISEVLQAGNVSLVVDIDTETNLPYICVYETETSINWLQENKTKRTVLAVFKTAIRADNAANDKFITGDLVPSCLVYDFQDEKVTQTQFVDGLQKTKVNPSLQGTAMEDIPVVYIGSIQNSPIPQAQPLLGISEIAYSIYRQDADLAQAKYMTCNPNLVISGMQNEAGVPSIVGSTTALMLPNPQAKAYYTETDTSALDHVSNAIQDLFQEAMMYGASLSGPTKKGAEAKETVQMRGNNQGATLVGVVKNVAKGMKEALDICAKLLGESGEIIVSPSLEFSQKFLSPQMLTALTTAWMGSGLSKETLLRNFKEAGILKEDEDIEDELARIENEGPVSGDDETLSEKKPKVPKKKNKGQERKDKRKKKQKEEDLLEEQRQLENKDK